MRTLFSLVTRSFLGLAGVVLTTVSGVIFVSLFALEQVGMHGGPYLGILAYLVLPALFVLGLLLIPIGLVRARRRQLRGDAPLTAPVLDFNRPVVRNATIGVGVLTCFNVVLVAAGTYKGVEVMESNAFCGGACHSVMHPEATTHARSPHSRVQCTACHIGPGASWFVKSKLSGSWQLVSVALNLYPRPIPTPVHNLRPARETCEQCHWPTKFVGERLKVLTQYTEDEQAVAQKTVLLMNVGGVQDTNAKGIHWHVDPRIHIRYRSDPSRRTIYDVELKDVDGSVKLFKPATPPPPGAPLASEWRSMDCVDCHNRPTHVLRPPEVEVDEALARGVLDPSLPFIKREGLRILKADYASHEAAAEGIAAAVRAQYPSLSSEKAEELARRLFDLYRVNVFPKMAITWGTYPSLLGHEGACFRCHDNEHQTASGEKISKGCSLCHEVLATKEEDPEILQILHP